MEFNELDESERRHARPAPRGPAPIHWWAARVLGLLIIGAALALHFSGAFAALPAPPRQLVPWVLGTAGAIIFILGLLVPWLTEG